MASKNGRGETDGPGSGKSCERNQSGSRQGVGFSKIILDTTVQEKAVAYPTDARLAHKARRRLVRLAKKRGLDLRQSYERVGDRLLIAHQRYAHAKPFRRAAKALRKLRT